MRYAIVLVGMVTLMACATPEKPAAEKAAPTTDGESVQQTPPEPPGREVTINADDGTGMIIPQINVWDNYQTRSRIVATVHHGDKVFLIRSVARDTPVKVGV